MSRSPRTTRRSTSRLQPRVESLEERRLFSVAPEVDLFSSTYSVPVDVSSMTADLSTLSVVGVDPADGAVVPVSPSVINVTFNQPFEPITVGFDFALYQVDGDGNVINDLSWQMFEPFDLTGEPTVLPITVDGTLADGTYQLVLMGSLSFLTGLPIDGGLGAPLAIAGVDEVISTFQIVSPPPPPSLPQPETFADAVDLGTLGAIPLVSAGALDLGANSGDYHLYQFELGTGHFWRFGAEVTAQRDGSLLNPAIALFDAQGRVLKSADTGRLDAPKDPFLFAGLAGGTYYIGISGTMNLPDLPGSYDPVAGAFGNLIPAQDGGTYRLHVLAEVHDSPTEVQSVQLSYADPLDPRPTGVVVTFAGPMDITSFKEAWDPDDSEKFVGLQVIDQRDQVWTLTPVNYDERANQFAFLFEHPLDKGKYRLIVPEERGVTDLAGLAPLAAPSNQGQGNHNGNPDGDNVLATWHVTASAPETSPNNLGAVLTGLESVVPGHVILDPGASLTVRFVAPVAGLYGFQALVPSGLLSVSVVGSGGTVDLQSVNVNIVSGQLMNLDQGVYYLQITNSEGEPVDLTYWVYWKTTFIQAVFDNGVGQGPALNLVILDPVVIGPVGGPVASTVFAGPAPLAGATTAPGGSTTSFPNGPSTSTVIAATTVETASGNALVLTLGNSLVGSPSATAEQVSAVGPGTQAGVTALAANTTGVLQGITYGQSLPSVSPYGPVAPESDGDADMTPAPGDDAGSETESLDGALAKPVERPAPSQDQRALAAASGWLGGLGSALLSLFGASAPRSPALESLAEPLIDPYPVTAEPIQLVHDGDPTPPEAGAGTGAAATVEHADLATPLGLSVISVLALRARRPVGRWMGRRNGQNGRRASAAKTAVKGPHAKI